MGLYFGAQSSRQITCSQILQKNDLSHIEESDTLQTMLIEMMCSRFDANRVIAYNLLVKFFTKPKYYELESS